MYWGFFVAGWIESFPTHYPDEGFFAVADLGHLERSLGESPWNVLARLRPDVGAGELVGGLRELGFRVIQAFDARELLASARNDATRIGTFGILTAGFVISVLLTVASLTAYALISFPPPAPGIRDSARHGSFAAQMVALIMFEHGFLVLFGDGGRHRTGDRDGRAVHSLHAARWGRVGRTPRLWRLRRGMTSASCSLCSASRSRWCWP